MSECLLRRPQGGCGPVPAPHKASGPGDTALQSPGLGERRGMGAAEAGVWERRGYGQDPLRGTTEALPGSQPQCQDRGVLPLGRSRVAACCEHPKCVQ